MRRFHFRLERILEIRRYREREAELELAAATARCVELEQRIADRERRMRKELRDRAAGGRLDLRGLQASETYRLRLQSEARLAALDLEARREEQEKLKSAYLAASRDRKVLDKLREKRERDYYRNQRQEEFREMDDSTSARRRSTL